MSEVVDSAWRENYKFIFSPQQIAAYTGENRRRSFKALLNDGKDIYVLTVDGMVSGVCAVQTCEQEPFIGYAEIMLMYISPRFQGQGLGSRLLTHALNEICKKGYIHAVLDTAEKNENARRFYEKLGFTEFKTDVSRKFDNVTRVIYTRQLL